MTTSSHKTPMGMLRVIPTSSSSSTPSPGLEAQPTPSPVPSPSSYPTRFTGFASDDEEVDLATPAQQPHQRHIGSGAFSNNPDNFDPLGAAEKRFGSLHSTGDATAAQSTGVPQPRVTPPQQHEPLPPQLSAPVESVELEPEFEPHPLSVPQPSLTISRLQRRMERLRKTRFEQSPVEQALVNRRAGAIAAQVEPCAM